MESDEMLFNEFDEAEYYIKEDDDADGISLEESEDSDLCEEECNVCAEPEEQDLVVIQEPGHADQKEQLHYIYMKKYIDSLNDELHEKNVSAGKTRNELEKCQDRISELERERDRLFYLIEHADEHEDIPNGDRLRAQHDRSILELEMERGIEDAIKGRLSQAEFELAQAELQKGKYLLAEDDLHRQHSRLREQKLKGFDQRKRKDDAYVQSTYRRQQRALDDVENASREYERREKHALNEAMKAKERTGKMLKQTMQEVRDQTKQENERHSADLNRRITAVLSLKNNITTNRENINALRARNKDLEKEAQKADKVYKDQITNQGGDAETALLVKKRIEQMDRSKIEHEIKQREAEVKLASKLISEENQFRRRKKMYPHLWQEKEWEQGLRVKPHRKKKLRTLADDTNSSHDYESYVSQLETLPKLDTTRAPEAASAPAMTNGNRASFGRRDSSGDEAIVSKLGNTLPASDGPKSKTTVDSQTLAKPEFEGMWNKFQRYVVPKEVVVDVIKGSKVSKMDQDIMREKLQMQRENIVQTQIAAGREFKGKSSFNSKPTVVHFKDFDVGKSYKKRVTLTNVSYSINFCKLTGLSDHLKDFLEITFDPPGQLSAGMTCEILITFKPMINEDLEGVINFLSQTGPFELPVVCSTKKCDLSVDMTEVQFGMSVIGETLKRHITLTNNGALGTRLMFGKYTGKDHHIITANPADYVQREETPVSENGMAVDSPQPNGNVSNRSDGGLSKPLSAAGSVNERSQAEDDEDAGSQNELDSEAASSIGASLSEDHDLDLDGMMVSENNSVYIRPFSQEKLEIVWRPTVPGKCDAQFILSFEDELSKDITLTSNGTSIDVPVYVTRQNIDLQICTLDRLYQDSIIVKNRATSALKLMFEVPKPLRKHMELLPKTGFVQAQSSFSAQLKFLPRSTIAEDALEYFDKETGVLEVPLMINVADQTRPVPFVVHAVVTNSDLQFNVTDIDFGHCTIYESTRSTIQLTNKSILPQEFGFMGLPEYVDIQPNDGFGILLPEETIDLHVIFSPPKAKIYTFELCCKSLIDREFNIKCRGVGVHPPMELSDQVVHFKATSLNDYSLNNIYVINNHLSTNEYTHPVPRIGKGSIAPVGPTSFEFKVPEGAPLNLYPSVGTVQPGEKLRVQVRFAPTLPVNKIQQEAVRVVVRKGEERAQKEYDEKIKREKDEAEAQAVLAAAGATAGKKKATPGKPAPAGKASPKGKGPNRPQTGPQMDIDGPEPVTAPSVDGIQLESDEYASAHSTLLRQFEGEFETYTIPCYLSSGPCAKPGDLKYSIHNTLYLEVHCPTVKPQVVVISDNGRATIDYGDVSIGQQMNKTITIQNIYGEEIDLTGSLLDTTGPFEMRNPLRELPADSSHSLIIRFAPLKSDVFQETLHIYGPESTLHVNLLGRGVNPTIQLNLEDRVFDMGAVLVNEYMERNFRIKNTSSLSVDYSIKFDSLSPLRYKTMQDLPDFVRTDGEQSHIIGVQNFNGKCVFDCVPFAGTIPGGGSQEIMLTFAPDHASDYYSDGVHVELFNMEEAYSFQVIGQAKEHIMYVTGGQLMKPNVESLLPMVTLEPDEERLSKFQDMKPIAGHVLLMFYSVARDGVFSTTTTDLIIGCVRTMAVSQKKNGEYAFENMNAINAKGFTIAEPKAYLEAGTKKNVTITWTPPETHNPDEPIEATILVSTKCEIAENYQILLRGLIVSRPPENPEAMTIEDLEQSAPEDRLGSSPAPPPVAGSTAPAAADTS